MWECTQPLQFGQSRCRLLLCLEVRWINVSALLWCRARFPTACLWLIKHIDWPVSGLEGWPAAAFCGAASTPSLSLGWKLKVKSNTGCKVMSAHYIWKHSEACLHLHCFTSAHCCVILLTGNFYLSISSHSPLHIPQRSSRSKSKELHCHGNNSPIWILNRCSYSVIASSCSLLLN